MIKLIILSRDGVINEDLGRPVTTVDEWVPIAGSLEAIARLNQEGWSVAIVTNQSGIGLGILELATLHDIHKRMYELLNEVGGKIDVVAFCPHTDTDGCACRKPAPGMLYSISERLGISLNNVTMVGDSLHDMQAAMASAVSPVIVRTGKGLKTLDKHKGLEHIPAFDDLASYVDDLLAPKVDEEADKADKPKVSQAKAQSAKPQSSKSVQSGKSEVSKSQSSKQQSNKTQTSKNQSSKAQVSKTQGSKPASDKSPSSKALSTKSQATKSAASKTSASKATDGKETNGKASSSK